MAIDKLAELIPRFIVEARRQVKTPYPPNTLVMLVNGMQRRLRANGKPDVATMSDKDARFARTHATLDARLKQLTKEGMGTV